MSHHLPNRASRLLVTALAVCLLAACANRATLRYMASKRYPRRPDDYPIQITAEDYNEPYVILAQATTHIYELNDIELLGRAELERMARRLGGDAVVHTHMVAGTGEEHGYKPGDIFRSGSRYVEHYRLKGVIVRFARRRPVAPPPALPTTPPPATEAQPAADSEAQPQPGDIIPPPPAQE